MRAGYFLTGPYGVRDAPNAAEICAKCRNMEIREVKDNGGMIPSRNQVCRTWLCVDQPVLNYREAWRLQVELVAARHAAVIGSDIMLLLEHPPVFTLGRRGGRENLTVSESFLENPGFQFSR